jgi:hypothetical protein
MGVCGSIAAFLFGGSATQQPASSWQAKRKCGYLVIGGDNEMKDMKALQQLTIRRVAFRSGTAGLR